MAELVALAASITGLISLGLQVFEGLKAYADSAHDSKNRVTGITIDVNLTLEVVRSLETSLNEDSNRAEISADSVKLGLEVIARCHELFAEIKTGLPHLGSAGLRKRDIVKWPFAEPKVNVLRVGLGEVKTTLQLWMSVIIMAVMRRRQAGQAILDQQIDLIVKLNEDKINLEAELASLKADYVHTIPQTPSTPQRINLIDNSIPRPTVEDYVEADDEQRPSIYSKPPGKGTATSHVSSSSSSSKSNSDLPEHEVSGHEYGLEWGHSSSHGSRSESSVQELSAGLEVLARRKAYMECSHHLETVRQDLSNALRETFRSSDFAYLAPSYQEEHTYRLLGNLDRSCLQAYHCLKDTILDSPAHARFRSPYDGVLNTTEKAQKRLPFQSKTDLFNHQDYENQCLRSSARSMHEPVTITIDTGVMSAPISISIPTQQHNIGLTSAERNNGMKPKKERRKYHLASSGYERPAMRPQGRSSRPLKEFRKQLHPAGEDLVIVPPPPTTPFDDPPRHRIAQELQQKRAEDVELVEHLLHAWTKLYGEAADDAVVEERPTVEDYPIIEEDANIVELD